MAKPTRTRKDDQKNIKEVAKQVAREALLEMNTQEEEGPDDDTLSFIDNTSTITEDKRAQDPTGFDIFSDIGEPRTEQGDIIRYVIRKWGQHIATKFHPYSWEDLHEEFGAGNYQVIARSDSTKKFVKSESRILGDARSAFKKQHEDSKEETIAPPPQQQGLGFMELFTLLQEQQKQAKEEARELNRDSQTTQNQMMILVAELMKANSSSGASSSVQMMQMITQMIQQQQQTTNQIFEKLAENQTRMFEKINERIEKVSEKKSTEFDMFNKGIEMFSKMNELAEKRVQLQLEMLEEAKEEARGETDTDAPKKKSVTDSLIEGILPVVSQALVAQQQGPALVAQQQQQLMLQQQAIRRRQLQIAAARRNQANRTVPARPRAEEARIATPSAETQTTGTGEVETSVEASGPVSRPDVVRRNGLPSISIGEKAPDVTTPDVLDFSGEDEATLPEGLKDVPTSTVKEQCQKLLPEFLGKMMLEGTQSDVAATQTIEMLKTQGIGREEFLKEVASDDLLDVAKQYGLPEAAFEWLNELYAHIQSKPRNVVRRKPSQGRQPEVEIGMAR